MKPSHAVLLFLLAASPAMAEGASVEIQKPRLFGYFIGDIIADDVLITFDSGVTLKASSLPAPGTLNYWLNLKSIAATEEQSQDGKARFRLKLKYQTFYDPLEPHWLNVPSFQLILDNAGQTASVDVPEWSFLSSPIREVSPKESRGNTFIQPDVPPYEKSLNQAWRWIYGSSIAVLISYLALAYSRAWVPFRRHPERPFTKTARLLRSLTHKTAGEDTYRQALILLHLAFNKTGHRAVLADDLPEFLSFYPRFRTAEADISKFLAASRRTFFGHDCRGAMREFSIVEVVSLSQRLSAAERGLQ
jgi:mxaA protein